MKTDQQVDCRRRSRFCSTLTNLTFASSSRMLPRSARTNCPALDRAGIRVVPDSGLELSLIGKADFQRPSWAACTGFLEPAPVPPGGRCFQRAACLRIAGRTHMVRTDAGIGWQPPTVLSPSSFLVVAEYWWNAVETGATSSRDLRQGKICAAQQISILTA